MKKVTPPQPKKKVAGGAPPRPAPSTPLATIHLPGYLQSVALTIVLFFGTWNKRTHQNQILLWSCQGNFRNLAFQVFMKELQVGLSIRRDFQLNL